MGFFVLYLLVAALDVAFAISLTPPRWRIWAALAAAGAAYGALYSHVPVVPWLPYIIGATYLGAVINRRLEAGDAVVTRRRVPRL